ncbi:MAG: DUF2079 domain-containing protein [Actinomycetota bacterium]
MSGSPHRSSRVETVGSVSESLTPGLHEAAPPIPRSAHAARVLARPWPLVVWVALASWSALLFAQVRSDYLGFRLARFDLGNMVQAVWSTAHGRPLEMTLLSGEQAVRFASHVDPILVLFAPFFVLWPSPLVLAGGQIAACALGALPVFWLGRRHLASEQAAALLALAYLAYPWLAWTALDAMHPVTLAIPLFLYAIWFLDSDRLWGFALCALLVAATGELMGLPLAALGLWYWLARGHRRSGLLIAAAGFAWSLLAVKVIVPAFHGEESPFYERFTSVGGSPEGILRTALTDPGAIVSAVLSRPDLVYVAVLALPLAGAFLLAPGLAAVALPQLAVNALSDWHATTDSRHHYVAAIVPFLVAASTLGLSRVPPAKRVQAATIVLAFTVTSAVVLGPWPGAPGARTLDLGPDVPASRADALRAAVALVPKDARVSATSHAGSHLSGRQYFYSVPLVEGSEWIVLDTQDPWIQGSELGPARFDSAVGVEFKERMRSSPEWKQVFAQEGVFVFRKVPLP